MPSPSVLFSVCLRMVAGLGWRRSPVRKRFQTVHRCISHKWLTAAAWENRRMGLPGWYRMRKFPFPPFPFPGDYFGLPEHCIKPATYLRAYLSGGILKALTEMVFQKQRKLKFYLFTLESMIIKQIEVNCNLRMRLDLNS